MKNIIIFYDFPKVWSAVVVRASGYYGDAWRIARVHARQAWDMQATPSRAAGRKSHCPWEKLRCEPEQVNQLHLSR